MRNSSHRWDHRRKAAFTLIELLLVVGIMGALAAIVITAVAPKRQLLSATDATRFANARALQNAMTQYSIDNGAFPDSSKFPDGAPASEIDRVQICAQGISDASCIDVYGDGTNGVVKKYIASVPRDEIEPCTILSGYYAYTENARVHVAPMWAGKTAADAGECTVLSGPFSLENGIRKLEGVGDRYLVSGLGGSGPGETHVLPAELFPCDELIINSSNPNDLYVLPPNMQATVRTLLQVTKGKFAMNPDRLGGLAGQFHLVIDGGEADFDDQRWDLSPSGAEVSSGNLHLNPTWFTLNSGNWEQTGGVVNADQGMLVFQSTSDQTVTSIQPLRSVMKHSSSKLTALSPITVTSMMQVSYGTFDSNGFDITLGTMQFQRNVSPSIFLASTGKQTYTTFNCLGGDYMGSSGAVDVNGNLNLAGCTLNAPTGALTVSGNITRSSGTFNPGTGTVTMDGTTQSISGALSFNNLIISSGVTTLQNDITVSGTLTIAAGATLNANGMCITYATLQSNGTLSNRVCP